MQGRNNKYWSEKNLGKQRNDQPNRTDGEFVSPVSRWVAFVLMTVSFWAPASVIGLLAPSSWGGLIGGYAGMLVGGALLMGHGWRPIILDDRGMRWYVNASCRWSEMSEPTFWTFRHVAVMSVRNKEGKRLTRVTLPRRNDRQFATAMLRTMPEGFAQAREFFARHVGGQPVDDPPIRTDDASVSPISRMVAFVLVTVSFLAPTIVVGLLVPPGSRLTMAWSVAFLFSMVFVARVEGPPVVLDDWGLRWQLYKSCRWSQMSEPTFWTFGRVAVMAVRDKDGKRLTLVTLPRRNDREFAAAMLKYMPSQFTQAREFFARRAHDGGENP